MDISVGVDTFVLRENQVWSFKVEITNFKSLLKPQTRKVLLQQGDQIKILHMYESYVL